MGHDAMRARGELLGCRVGSMVLRQARYGRRPTLAAQPQRRPRGRSMFVNEVPATGGASDQTKSRVARIDQPLSFIDVVGIKASVGAGA